MNGQAPPAAWRHDLRTSVHQIIGFTELLIEEAREAGRAALAADLEKIRAAAARQLHLLEEIAQVPQISPGAGTGGGPPPGPRAPASVGPGPRPRAPQPPGHILVVDDEEANRELLRRFLTRLGHEVTTARSGAEAMALCRARAPDLILLDLLMPDMDGTEVLRALQQMPEAAHLPVIMLSSMDDLQAVVTCVSLGAADYLPRPWEDVLLEARIGACLEKKRLSDQEHRLYEELAASHAQLQRLEAMRDDLTHMLIHDLRAPLCTVMLAAQGVRSTGSLGEQQRALIDTCLRGGDALLGMINDMLDVSRLEEGEQVLQRDALRPRELLVQALEQVQLQADQKQIQVRVEVAQELPPCEGDAKKLQRTLVNLLANAIKFTPRRGQITASIRTIDDGAGLCFAIRDTGPGIPAEAFGVIFEKYRQLGAQLASGVPSSGLGLTFCKRIVEAHGGRIWVESEEGQGSTFAFKLPAPPSYQIVSSPRQGSGLM